MIADRLPEDSKHIVGGSVEVNGIDRKNGEIHWSVSLVLHTGGFLLSTMDYLLSRTIFVIFI
jgi:hypothetical protein